MDYYDLTIIGAGWAGFNAAIKAASLGLKTVLIEKDSIGGTCLNHGCIPTKSLIQSAKLFSLSKKASKFGINFENPTINYQEIQSRKNTIIKQLAQGMQFLLKKSNLTYLNVTAKIKSNQEVEVDGKTIKTKYILITTGSKPMELKAFPFDGKKILSSKQILNLEKIPESILIVGGGVIGCEFASLFNTIGSKVHLVELLPQLLPQEDIDVVKKLTVTFKKAGIKVDTETDATKLDLANYEIVLVCVGRVAYANDLGLEQLGVHMQRGGILVDQFLSTNVENVYAAGDCTAGIMLAHFAAHQGELAVWNMVHADKKKKCNASIVPATIFTAPEIASAGINEKQARDLNIDIEVSKFDFLASGMARIIDQTDGFIKLIWDKHTGELLGASIIGPGAVELIATLTLAIQSKLKSSQILSTIFAHPTLSECIEQAAKA